MRVIIIFNRKGVDVVLDEPGVRRVAVKMVRFDHLGTLSDLASEYTMMKEVDHENVIKLLGACTDKRGPFYIILEYAEHGSLRLINIMCGG